MVTIDQNQSAMDPNEQHRAVADYYGKTLETSNDLKTSACCPIDAVPPAHREHLAKLHPEVVKRFYGCGSPIPDHLKGCTVLDLGCGTGRDVYLASALVGPTGTVIGVDMTDEQLTVAREHRQFHADTFFGSGSPSNVDFRKGFIEDLRSADIEDESVDVVISNCVCNLSPDKRSVFAETARVLRTGGEFYFSDVYADRRLSEEARKHEVLVAECLGGALYIEDFRRIMAEVGFKDVRVVAAGSIELHDDQLRALVPDVRFYSITIRAFKVPGFEDRRENYGQVATYTSCCGSGMRLDIDNSFEKRVPRPVDANTAAILKNARFQGKFQVTERGEHQGLFKADLERTAIGSCIDCFRALPMATTVSKDHGTKDEPSNVSSRCAPANGSGKQSSSCCTPNAAVSDASSKTIERETESHLNTQQPAASCGPTSSCC